MRCSTAGALEEVRALDARNLPEHVAGDEGAWRAVAVESFSAARFRARRRPQAR